MKRLNNVFDLIVDFNNLKEAHVNASKGKNHYDEVKAVNVNVDLHIAQLQGQLIRGEFTTSEYTVMERMEGKKLRVIHVLFVRDSESHDRRAACYRVNNINH